MLFLNEMRLIFTYKSGNLLGQINVLNLLSKANARKIEIKP